jgi:DNA (cytosine-5)-methyltransferase 1/tRNA (cytosine38-C5)-methyltransferase
MGHAFLELFAGIGGLAEAGAEVARAVDQSPHARTVYAANFPHPWSSANILGLDAAALAAPAWWLSPPCQPFTGRGLGRDVDDPRCRPLLHLLRCLASAGPTLFAMENVPGFRGSRAWAAVREALAGWHVRERLLCPTALGVPMRRLRYYLVASRHALADPPDPPLRRRPLAEFLAPEPGLEVAPDLVARFGRGMHVVNEADPEAETACFTAAYGRSPNRAGSYLRTRDGRLRRFSPREIANLLGFRPGFALPVPRAQAWELLGNSLSVDAVRAVLGLAGPR